MIKQGLRENWKQFTLLLIVNSFVGGMIGMERSIIPRLAIEEFNIIASGAIMSFIVFFGISKAFTNYYMGKFANKMGRKNLLILGWIIAIPIPILMIHANSWWVILFANVLLGINQGLTWSSAVIMKIELVGDKNRGFAVGLNESVGYLSVGIFALVSGYLASEYGVRPVPFFIMYVLIALGIISSLFFIKDTEQHVKVESKESNIKKLNNVFTETTWINPNLGSISFSGMVNNLNDGMIWGLFPILLINQGFSDQSIGYLISIYPTVWGISQLITGKLADQIPVKKLLFWGMLMQGIALLGILYFQKFNHLAILSIIIGIGTAVVYPTFIAGVAENTHPEQRAQSIGVFRLWRDLGYAIGALSAGIIADLFGLFEAIFSIGIITIISSLVIAIRMTNKDNSSQIK